MVARVNGEERSRGNLGDMLLLVGRDRRARGAQHELRPGDVLGSGTVGTGCILEHGDERWLQRGDGSSSRSRAIGVLRNQTARIR